MGTESRSRCRSTNRPHGDELSRFSYPRNVSNSDLVTVNMWVVTSIVIKVFPSIVISDRRCKLVSSRSRTAAVAVGPNRKLPSPIKYDGLTRTVLEKVFRPVYYRWKCRSIIFIRKFSWGKCSCVDDYAISRHFHRVQLYCVKTS